MKTLCKLFIITSVILSTNSKIYFMETSYTDTETIQNFAKTVKNCKDLEEVIPLYKQTKRKLQNKQNKEELIRIIDNWTNTIVEREGSPFLIRLISRIK